MGCLIDTPETQICKYEDVKSTVPCTPYGKSCEKVTYGRCATSSLCCNPDYCVQDPKCALQSSDESSVESIEEDEETINKKKKIIQILKFLLEKKVQANGNQSTN